MPSYQPGIPTGTVNFDVDYQNVQGNFQALDTTFGVDHIPFSGTQNNGYHTAIHMVPSNPTPVSGISELFCKSTTDFNTDNSLFYQTAVGGTRLAQLTCNFIPVATSSGITFIPGGIILQWGMTTGISSSGAVPQSFNRTFPHAVFNVFVTGLRSNNGGDGIFVDSTTPPTTAGFSFRNGSGSIMSAYWFAIGN